MEQRIPWSYYHDEMDLVFEKADQNLSIASLLSELEAQAIREAETHCGIVIVGDERLTPEAFRAMNGPDKAAILCHLGKEGLESFSASMTEPVIRVVLSPHIQWFMACTMFNILNRLEKLDGAYNVVRFPKATLELHFPLGGRTGLIKWGMLIMQLYPWLSVSEKPRDVAAVPVPAAPARPAQPPRSPEPPKRAPAVEEKKQEPKKGGFFSKLFGKK